MFKGVNNETNDLIGELVFARLAVADVEGKTDKWFNDIKTSDNQQSNDIISYACEVQRYSYLAGLKDGARLAVGLGVTINE